MDRISLLGNLNHFDKNGVIVASVPTATSAHRMVKKVLEDYSDQKTAIFLSGASGLKKIYEEIALDKTLKAGAALQIDERFGEPGHRNSNNLKLETSGILDYFENQNIRYYPILQKDKGILDTALQYDETLRFLFSYFPKTVGVLEIGADGGIGGVPSDPAVVRKMMEDQSSLVTFYGVRNVNELTMTFLAISQLDLILLLAAGNDKRELLSNLFRGDSVEEMPVRFLLKPELSAKTILITDQIL